MLEALSQGALGVALVICIGWALVVVRVFRTIGALRRLPSHIPPRGAPRPRVSAVIAARNEVGTIARAVRSLLGQEGVDMQVVVVDDGSEDGTYEVLQELAKDEPRLLVLRSTQVPRGWIAKSYALELGQGRADGDFLLFTDADVFHGRRAVYNAVRVMEEEALDHLAVHPRLEAGSLVEALVLPLYVLIGEFRFVDPRAASPESGVGAGVGAFNLVRAESYRLRGTHARIRGAFLDDRALGRMMRDDGGRGTVMRAVSQVRMRPYRSFSDLYAGIRKGTLMSAQQSAAVGLLMGVLMALGAVVPTILLAAGVPVALAGEFPWFTLPALLAFALPIAGMLKARSMVRFEPLAALLFPLGALIIAASTIHAAILFGMRGTLEWRGRHYSRAELRGSLDELF